MVKFSEFLKPNRFKIILFFLLSIPCITLLIAALGQGYIYNNLYHFSSLASRQPLVFAMLIFVFSVVGMVFSYILGSLIDHFIQNERLKIIIAVVSGILTLLIIYTIYKMVTEPVICDPVHYPNNQTICDPVHEPGQGETYSTHALKNLEVDSSTVKDSFWKCIENLK